MATAFRIPLRPSRAAQTVAVTLDGRRYRLRLDWLGRLQRWSFSLSTVGGTLLLGTKGLVLGADLLKHHRHNPEIPQGVLYLEDLQGAGEEATLDSLGVRHVLRFVLP
jgi:hypothetical protein